MKKSESSLNAPERVSKFDADKFAVNDEIIYRDPSAGWVRGKLARKPEVTPDKAIKITLTGRVEHVVHIPPKLVEFSSTTGRVRRVKYDGKEYGVGDVHIGPNGEIWYDLTDPATPTRVVLRKIDQEVIRNLSEISKIETKLTTAGTGDIARLVTEVKKVQGEKRTELMKQINDLELKIKEMHHQISDLGELSELEAGQMVTVSAEIKKIKSAIDAAIRKLDTEISEIIAKEEKSGEVKERKENAETFQTMIDREFAGIDRTAKIKFDSEHAKWVKKSEAFERWDSERKVLTEALKAAKNDNALKAVAQRAIDDFDRDPRNIPRPVKPPPEKTFEKPSGNPIKQEEITIQIFNDLTAARLAFDTANAVVPPATPPVFRFADFLDSVDAKRKANAAKEGLTDYLHPGRVLSQLSPRAIETIKIIKEMIEEWKNLQETEAFNFKKEKAELEADVERLVFKLQTQTGVSRLETRLEAIRTNITALKSSTAGVDKVMIDYWRELGNLEKDILSAELKTKASTTEREVKFVDLPRGIMKEMMLAKPAEFKEVVKQSYDAVISEGKSTSDLELAMAKWLDGIDVDATTPPLRGRMAQYGIKDWEGFRKQFKNKLSKDFSLLMMANTDSQLRNLLTQKIADIKNNPARWKFYTKDFWREIRQEHWDTSTFVNMKASMAARMGINIAVLGTIGGGLSLALKLVPIPGVVKAGIVGSAVGFAKAGIQRIMGKDTNYYSKEQERAKKVADEKKKQFITDELMSKMFTTDVLNPGIKPEQVDMMADMFTISMRKVTGKKEGQELAVTDGTETITLKGDTVCMFHEMLKNAAEAEGVDVEDKKIRLEFAKALYALHNNDAIKVQEQDPIEVRAWQKIIDIYSGKSSVASRGGQSPDMLRRQGLGAQADELEKKQKMDFGTQAMITAGMGGSVAAVMVYNSDIGRGVLGATIFGLAGEKAGLKSERNSADRDSIQHVESNLFQINTHINDALTGGSHTVSDGHTKMTKEYYDLFSVLLAGRSLNELTLTNIPADDLKYYQKHAKDVAGMLQRNTKYRSIVEGTIREISRSGLLEKAGFMACLANIQNTTTHMGKAAENSMGTKFGSAARRHIRAVIYAGIGLGTFLLVGQGIEAAKHHLSTETSASGTGRPEGSAIVGGARVVAGGIPSDHVPMAHYADVHPSAPKDVFEASRPDVVPTAEVPESFNVRPAGLVEAPTKVSGGVSDWEHQMKAKLGITEHYNKNGSLKFVEHSLRFHPDKVNVVDGINTKEIIPGAKITLTHSDGTDVKDVHGKVVEFKFSKGDSVSRAMDHLRSSAKGLLKAGEIPTVRVSGNVQVGDDNGHSMIEKHVGGKTHIEQGDRIPKGGKFTKEGAGDLFEPITGEPTGFNKTGAGHLFDDIPSHSAGFNKSGAGELFDDIPSPRSGVAEVQPFVAESSGSSIKWSTGGAIENKAGLEAMLHGTQPGGAVEAGAPQVAKVGGVVEAAGAGGVKGGTPEVAVQSVGNKIETVASIESAVEIPAEIPEELRPQYLEWADVKENFVSSFSKDLNIDIKDNSGILSKLMNQLDAGIKANPNWLKDADVRQILDNPNLTTGDKLSNLMVVMGEKNLLIPPLSPEEQLIFSDVSKIEPDDNTFERFNMKDAKGNEYIAGVVKGEGSHVAVYQDVATGKTFIQTDPNISFTRKWFGNLFKDVK